MSNSRSQTPKRNIRLIVEYKGTHYRGWQRQKDLPSVQQEIEIAIKKITGVHQPLTVAGRTDAGVHALEQVAAFFTHHPLPIQRFARAINHFLPKDICIHRADEVNLNFNVREHSLSKQYVYSIYQARERSAIEAERSHWIRDPLDLQSMQQASKCLIGENDFNAFRSVHCDAAHAIRMIYSINISQEQRKPCGRMIHLTFHGNAFCRYMCRILAGTLLEVGQQKRSIESVASALKSKDRQLAGMTAPACGLTLVHVEYPDIHLLLPDIKTRPASIPLQPSQL
ncbi:MAG TPA: tRNA pseudouridine(38-40) synthase TruA [Flavobacteriales bacterium]|nr:tRNA pseudouridine(38-40) synthase TruA [Flavobacteriales bacterium]